MPRDQTENSKGQYKKSVTCSHLRYKAGEKIEYFFHHLKKAKVGYIHSRSKTRVLYFTTFGDRETCSTLRLTSDSL